MSYQVLARKWRPRTFIDMVGQQHVLQTLANALTKQRLHHAYLLTGSHGIGKTSLARILAKCLNCDTGITATPCGQCKSCIEIDEGRSLDLLEIDAASRTKVEDTRELLDNVQYAPTHCRYKIYLIDEVHMLSGHSFNALLKTLEEPPAHVKFLLATTDPQRLPITVRSRCLQFNLKKLPASSISTQLATIMQQESYSHEAGALDLLAQAAQGSMRDALSLLDQAIAYTDGQLTPSQVAQMLGINDQTLFINLLHALHLQDTPALDVSINALCANTSDFHAALDQLLTLLHRIAMQQQLHNEPADSAIAHLATTLSVEDVQLYYQIGLVGKRDLHLAPSPQSGFEMVLLRMFAFVRQLNPSLAAQPPTPPSASMVTPDKISLPTAAATHVTPNTEITATTSVATWATILPKLKLTGITHSIAQHCSLESLTEHTITLCLDSSQQALLNDKQQQHLTTALQTYFAKAIKLVIHVAQANDSPARLAKQQRQADIDKARQQLETDPNIAAMETLFDAKLLNDSIAPIMDNTATTQEDT